MSQPITPITGASPAEENIKVYVPRIYDGKSGNWASMRRMDLNEYQALNPVLQEREVVWVIDTNQFVLGDGERTFNELYEDNRAVYSTDDS